MATALNGYSFCNGIIASGKLCDYEYFLITALFVKIKEISMKKILFLLSPICDFLRKIYCGFLKIDLGEFE